MPGMHARLHKNSFNVGCSPSTVDQIIVRDLQKLVCACVCAEKDKGWHEDVARKIGHLHAPICKLH